MKKLTFFILTINTFLIADILSVESPNFKASCSTNIDFIALLVLSYLIFQIIQ